jgi:hypothetical protein
MGEDGDGFDLPIGGAMEAAGLRYAGDERGGRREEGGEGEMPKELTTVVRRRSYQGSRAEREWLERTKSCVSSQFGPYGVGNEAKLRWNSGGPSRNSGRIPGFNSMPLQTREFGSEFPNS